MAKLMCKNIHGIHYVFWGNPWQTIFSSVRYIHSIGKEYDIDMRMFNFTWYNGWAGNDHHIQTMCYWRIVAPYFALKFAAFPFSINDFEIVPYYSEEGKRDCSYLVPKNKDLKFDAEIDGEKLTDVGYDALLNTEGKWDDHPIGDIGSEYHRLFRGAHRCSRIINKTIDNDRSICVSGDSMIIPLIPIFACYYKEVVYLDNRGDKSFNYLVGDKIFDDGVISMWDGEPKGSKKYTEINFK